MILEQSDHIINEVKKAFLGKDEIIRKSLMAIYAGGHILLEDVPGVGKTTLALAMSKALGLSFKRIQFTTDTMPSDITGFRIYNRNTGQFEFVEGAASCNLLLADEINRTSPKTQAALLEVMQEKTITVDGETHILPGPFICIATQNPIGAAGTQALPESQLDRFMIKMSIGYPDMEAQMDILKSKNIDSPFSNLMSVSSRNNILEIQTYLGSIHVSDEVLRYAIGLCEATRDKSEVELGVSPRGIQALVQMAKANAVLDARSYVVPEDIQYIFKDVCAHRIRLKPQARIEGVTEDQILDKVLAEVKPEIR